MLMLKPSKLRYNDHEITRQYENIWDQKFKWMEEHNFINLKH